jgi:hypothetical protein
VAPLLGLVVGDSIALLGRIFQLGQTKLAPVVIANFLAQPGVSSIYGDAIGFAVSVLDAIAAFVFFFGFGFLRPSHTGTEEQDQESGHQPHGNILQSAWKVSVPLW